MFARITFDPNIMGGRAGIRGMRITVSLVVNLVANGMSPDEIIREYPDLEPEDIREPLSYVSALANEEVHPFASPGPSYYAGRSDSGQGDPGAKGNSHMRSGFRRSPGRQSWFCPECDFDPDAKSNAQGRYSARVFRFCETYHIALDAGAIVIVEGGGCRLRHLPIQHSYPERQPPL